MKSSIGFDNVQFFMGIVENNIDPTNHGRVQVRVFGAHPPADTDAVTTADLPWAPVLNASNGTPIPSPGDWVFGIFLDGSDCQHPMVVGVIPGQNLQMPDSSGFSDSYTKPSEKSFANYGEPPLPKPQSGEDLETTQLPLQNGSLTNKQPAFSETMPTQPAINEPPVATSENPERNMVWKSRNSNSYIQIGEDDEFILMSHDSGSHIQVDGSGNIKVKSFGDSYMMSEGRQFETAQGSKTISIEGDYSVKAANVLFEIGGNLEYSVAGDFTLNAGGRISLNGGQSTKIAGQAVSLQSVSEHVSIQSAEKVKLFAGENVSLSSGAAMYLTSNGDVHTKGANIYLDGAETHIQSGKANPTPDNKGSTQTSTIPKGHLTSVVPEVTGTGTSIGHGIVDDKGE